MSDTVQDLSGHPDEYRAVLKGVGLAPGASLDEVRQKVESLGYQVHDLGIDRGGMLSTYVLYTATITDPTDESQELHQFYARENHATALALALASTILSRRRNPQA